MMICWILMYDEPPKIHGVVQFELQAKQWKERGYNYYTHITDLFDDDLDPAELEVNDKGV